MKQNKNFVASLITSVASFMLMPVALFWFANVLDMFKGGDASFVTVLLFVVLYPQTACLS